MQIKIIFEKERRDKRNLDLMLENDIKFNTEENDKLNKLLDTFTNELLFFKNDCGVKLESDLPKG